MRSCDYDSTMPPKKNGDHSLPEPVVERLPLYQRILTQLIRQGSSTVSSEQLAELAGLSAAMVRKDFSLLGPMGTRGSGYEVDYLLSHLDRILGTGKSWPVVIAGVGRLARALVGNRNFSGRGFRLIGAVDSKVNVIGTELAGLTVESYETIADSLAEVPSIGVITTPPETAQLATDTLVALGVRSLLNFAPSIIEAPKEIAVRYVDLSMELQILSYYASQPEGDLTTARLGTGGIQPLRDRWPASAKGPTPTP